jgi:hypothetical protein
VVAVNRPSHCCTMKDYIERKSHQIAENDQNANKGVDIEERAETMGVEGRVK